MDTIAILAKIFQRVKELQAENVSLKDQMQKYEKAVAALAEEMGIENGTSATEEGKKREYSAPGT